MFSGVEQLKHNMAILYLNDMLYKAVRAPVLKVDYIHNQERQIRTYNVWLCCCELLFWNEVLMSYSWLKV